MMKRTVLFAHGKESGPGGVKIRALSRVARGLGWQTLAPDFLGIDDPDQRVAMLLEAAEGLSGPLVLVGSSMGGYVMAEASSRLNPAAMLLLAPAVGIPFYPNPDPLPVAGQTLVVHGWRDEIIPVDLVIDWSRRHRVPLQVMDDNHVLHQNLSLLERELARLLQAQVSNPSMIALL